MTTVQLMTAEELLRMPDDGFRCELVKGELRHMPPAGQEHGKITAILTGSLVQHVLARNLGTVYAAETGFRIAADPDTVRAPDVAFIRRERLEETGEGKGFWPGAPDLAIEVISPGDSYAEVEEKVSDWLAAGARMVIVVNPQQRTAKVYRSLTEIAVLTESDTLDGSEVVPGWMMPLKAVFT